MQDALRSRVKGWARKPPTGLAGAAFWLTLWFCVLLILRLLPGDSTTFNPAHSAIEASSVNSWGRALALTWAARTSA